MGSRRFAGNGDQLSTRYDAANGGNPLATVAGTGNGQGRPAAGDVISYDTGGSGGHTSVVVGSRIDSGGQRLGRRDGTECVAVGLCRLSVVKHQVLSNYGGFITGWLTSQLRARR